MRPYYVYIMTGRSGTLYTGVTNDIERRVYEHRFGLLDSFTKKYHLELLVFSEEMPDVRDAIAREKQIKGWLRSKKVALIESVNPDWRDLADRWFPAAPPDPSLHSG